MPFIDTLPKAELHVHLEGTIEPDEVFRIAARNGITPRWPSADALRAACDFTGLEHFLALFQEGHSVLRTRRDFYDLAAGYLRRAAAQGVRRTEMFFGMQSFLDLGITAADQLGGVLDAVADARTDTGIDGAVIVTAERHRPEAEGLEMLDAVAAFRDSILGVGLVSAEADHPPSKYARFFETARARGYRLTCHAGEEGPAGYIRQALDLGVERIDHGYAAAGDPDLVARLADERIPLTLCPLSNLRLRVTDDLSTYPLATFTTAGVLATLNSDDPPYFGGYVNENYAALATAVGLDDRELAGLARNSFAGSFAGDDDVRRYLAAVDEHERSHAG